MRRERVSGGRERSGEERSGEDRRGGVSGEEGE